MTTAPAPTLYGIPNCDTVKKARAWLTAQGVAPQFHDWRKHGVPPQLADWAEALGWQALLNRRGLTWRRLGAEEQAAVSDAASALALMRREPAVIKRPVVVWGDGDVSVGFEPEAWARRLGR